MLTKTLSKVFVSTDTSKDWILVEMVPTFAVPVFEKGFIKKKWLLRMISVLAPPRSLRREREPPPLCDVCARRRERF